MGHKYHKFYDQPKKSENSENKVDEVVNEQMSFDEIVVNEDIVIEEEAVLTDAEVEELNEEDVMDVEVTEDGSLTEGVITGCSKLNVRSEAKTDSDVIRVLNKGDKVTIILDESTEDFYRVSIETTEGFCMKKFIEVK